MSIFRRSASMPDLAYIAGDTFVPGDNVITGSVSEKAMRLVPVYAATSWLADSVASLPMHAYRLSADGRRDRAKSALLDNPSQSGTVYDWKHRCMVSLLLRGNAYGLVTTRDGYGFPTTIEWLAPHAMMVVGFPVPRYIYNGTELPAADVLHVVGYAQPGSPVGLSPIGNFAATIEMGIGATNAARDWYKNGATPTYQLRNRAQTIEADIAAAAKDRFRASTRTGDVFVSGADWELAPIGVNASDAQFLDAMKATATQIASIYRVPPEKIGGETGSSLTYATTEQQSLDFLTHSLMPWLVRIEAAISKVMPQPLFAKFNPDALLRTDTLSRMQAHDIALRLGLETLDEGRALEDRPPLTPEQVSQWQELYAAKGSTTPTAGGPPA